MSDTTYHIKIKKEYASAILEDLQQVEAIEIVEDIPEWQQEEALKRLAAMKHDAFNIITEEAFFKSLSNQ
jgi:Mg/Co/Ni transporter MgtE